MLNENSNMPHLQALDLKYNPFPVVPDSQNYFTTEQMFSSISDVLHCIDARKGFILISGEVGLGKTTLSRLLLQKLANKKINTSLVLNTFLQSGSLLKAINNDFNIHIESEEISDQLDALNGFLLEQYANDNNCVIVIDDAQQLSLESLELVRQLSNLETNQNKLVQIILVAQSEILDTLNRNDMRQLKSRIALNLTINALNLQELEQYIDFRLIRAGSNGKITLEKNALKRLFKLTNGHPRRINLIMDRCLYVVAAYGNNKINKSLIEQAHHEITVTDTKKSAINFSLGWVPIAVMVFATVGLASYHYKDLLFIENGNIDKIELMSSNEVNVVDLANVKHTISLPKTDKIERSIELPVVKEEKIYLPVNSNESKYLQQFGLGKLDSDFNQAIKNNSFIKFNEMIQEKYGLNVLISHKEIVTDDNNEIWKYVVDNNQRWLTFWKPEIKLNAFYQGYYSQEVEMLQNHLQNEGYYRSNIDGLVGEKTIVAIAKFQKTVGINASGFPDELTLYQLQKRYQRSVNIGTELQEINEKSKSRQHKINNHGAYSLAKNSTITDLE